MLTRVLKILVSLSIANVARAWIAGEHFNYSDNASYTDWFQQEQLFYWRFGYTVSVNGKSVQGPGGNIVGKPDPDFT
jgi:hypothetical protein